MSEPTKVGPKKKPKKPAGFRKVRVKLEFVLQYPQPMKGIGEAGIGIETHINDLVEAVCKASGLHLRRDKPYIEAGSRLLVTVAR